MGVSEIIIGNICSFCAMITDSVSGTRRKNSEILGFQILGQFFYGVGSAILKGYSGTAQNVVAILRNIAAMKQISSKLAEWTLIWLGVVLGIAFNNRGFIGWLPIIANFQYSVSIFRFKDSERKLRMSFIVASIMFIFFSLAIMNYVGVISNSVAVVTTAVSLIRESRENAVKANDAVENSPADSGFFHIEANLKNDTNERAENP
ncbi:MAG: YgjV family protein [Lachnospiraceae bacterium]|nr:YgjV family protein [Lachnospiraceae bacterium]